MTDPARLLDARLDGSCRRAMKAAISHEPPAEAKAQVWQSITLALPAAGVLLGATTVAGGAKAAAIAASGAPGAGTVAATSGAVVATGSAAAGTVVATGSAAAVVGSTGLGLLAGKAIAIGLGIGLAFNVVASVGPRALESKPTALDEAPKPVLAAPVARTKPSPVTSPAGAKSPVASAVVGSLESPEVRLPAAAVTQVAKPSASTEPVSDELRKESELLVRTREAISASDARLALELIAEHRGRFSGGRLTQERDALEVQALAKSGQLSAAKARANAFLARYPESPHAEKVRAMVAAGAQPQD